MHLESCTAEKVLGDWLQQIEFQISSEEGEEGNSLQKSCVVVTEILHH